MVDLIKDRGLLTNEQFLGMVSCVVSISSGSWVGRLYSECSCTKEPVVAGAPTNSDRSQLRTLLEISASSCDFLLFVTVSNAACNFLACLIFWQKEI